MSQVATTQSSLSSIPTDLFLWWEEDFYSGKFICLPESRETFQHLDISDEQVSFSAFGSNGKLGGFNLSKKVPLLVNLCIDRILGLPNEVSGFVQVPPGLVPRLENQRKRKRLERLRLEWLLKELLHQEDSLASRLHVQSKVPQVTQATTNVFPRNCRSAWETDVKAHDNFNDGEMFQDYDGMSWCFLPVAVEGRDKGNWPIAALAHTVELMLPHRFLIQEDRVPPGSVKTVDDVLNRELLAAVARVKSALVKICPKLVHFCLDPALAYVWWGRGDVNKAEGMFLRIIDRIPNDLFTQSDIMGGQDMAGDVSLWTRQKALYLNEIGRMHSYFNQPQEAANFYKGAVDLISGFCQEIFPDCTIQSLMLQANAFDQGLMDTLKATRAAGLWDRVTSEPGCNPNLVQMAAESFLHCHAGYPLYNSTTEEEDQNTAWLLEARLRLQVLATSVPKVSLHLSLILAILGDDNAAEDAYMTYVQEYASHHPAFQQQIPGAVSMFIGAEMKNHPWWVFPNWAGKRSGRVTANKHLTVLPLHWRRVLRHCSCDMETFDGNQFNSSREASCRVAEVQSILPYLCLTQDGRLIGSFSENLPPLISVSLDPFTGALYLPEQFQEADTVTYGDIQDIGGRSDSRKDRFSFETFIPTPILTFDDSKDGRSVSLLTWQNRHTTVNDDGIPVVAETQSSKAKLVYSGCDGLCEINIAEVVLKAKKEVILQLLRNEGNDQNQERMKDASDFLDLCISKTKNMQYSFFKSAESSKRNPLEDVKVKLSSMTKNQLNDLLEPEFFNLKRVVLVGQSTAVIAFSTGLCQQSRSQSIDALVFLDCSNMGSFQNPVVQYPQRPDTVWKIPVKEGFKSNDGNILIVSEVSIYDHDKDRVYVFDNKGEIVHIHDELKISQVSNVCVKTDVGNDDMMVGTNRSRSKLILTDTKGTVHHQTKPIGALGIVEHFIAVFDMIFVSLRDRILVFDSSTLEPVQIVQDAALTDEAGSQRHVEREVGVLLTGERSFMKVLYKYEVASTSSPTSAPSSTASSTPSSEPSSSSTTDAHFRVILGVANHVFVLQRAKQSPKAPDEECPIITPPGPVTLITEVLVPGVPTEACFINRMAGFVVTASIFESSKLPLYRENLYWFDLNGHIRGIHPFLGQGPHGFYAVHLNEPNNMNAGRVEQVSVGKGADGDRGVWYLYFTDGLGGICCIKLHESLY
ncbi:uncharacterized protein [Asterias amurensis]|uniref:uncharacterized protein n=1 Tax=Asterias amurensis TaxID=7602 RepID=UPI003AB6F587